MSIKHERRAVVTGVSRGIGQAVAERLLDDGWQVVGTYHRTQDGADRLGAEHDALHLVRADLATEEGVARLLDSVRGKPLAALVNNAGIVEFERPGEFDLGLWQRTLAINLLAPVRLANALADQLAPGGSIVNICSTDGLRGSFASMAYAASKAALLNVTQSMANVLGAREVRVNAVTPGWIATEMADLAAEDAIDLTPLQRLGDPGEVANCVAWLVGEEASFVHGASLVVDGGLLNVDYVLMNEARAEA